MRYRKKPVEVSAVQLRWSNWEDVCELLGDALRETNPDGAWYISADEASDTCGELGTEDGDSGYIALNVQTMHGELATVRHGDWIIPDGNPGTFYPCKPDIFEAHLRARHRWR